DAGRQAVALELLPGVAAVGRAVQAAAGPAAGQLPGAAAGLPQGGEQHARVGRVEANLDGAGVGVLLEDLLPGLAAVGGAVDAARGGAGVVDERIAGDAGRAADAAAGEGADQAVLQVLEDAVVALARLGVIVIGAGAAGEGEGGESGEQGQSGGAEL